MKYSLLNNMHYVYKESFKKYPKIKWLLLINLITELLVPFLTVIITTVLVYSLTNEVDVELYILIIFGMIVLAFILESLRYWSQFRYNFENTFTRILTFWVRLSKHQITTDYENIEEKGNRKIISKAFESLQSNYFGIEMLLRQTPVAIINLIGMLAYGVLIAIYVPYILAILVLMTVVNFFLTKKANNYLLKTKTRLNDDFVEKYYLSKDSTNPNYGKDIRLYNIGKWFNELFVKLTKNRVKATKGIEQKFFFANLSNTTFLFIRDFCAYFLLLGLVINKSIDLTTFTFLMGIVGGFSMWLNGFTSAANHLRSSTISANEYRKCIDIKSITNLGKKVDQETLNFPLKIEFDNVTFSYPKALTPTLENLSFTINPGEKVALVGNNGAGKTTIVKLLCGLYRPTSGTIKVSGIDIMDFTTDEYMSLLSVVFQDSEPLALTIEDNITCTKSDEANNDKLWLALEKSGLKEKVLSLEHLEKTYLTQLIDLSGIRLSGGENQKLMLARALYKDAPILVLDEPTASLDPIAEETMYLKYNELVHGNTSIFISHRLSSTKFCDRIIFLDEGEIVEEGTHQELINLNKQYREVFDIQAQYYVEDKENEGH